MMHYILYLLVIVSESTRPTVIQVPGMYVSQSTCEAAGKAWDGTTTNRTGPLSEIWIIHSHKCVPYP